MKKDAIQLILSDLPATISYEGCTFQLQLIHNSNEIRLCYSLFMVDMESKHYNKYQDYGSWNNTLLFASGEDYVCDFLYLREGIETLPELEEAIHHFILFLQRTGLKPTML